MAETWQMDRQSLNQCAEELSLCDCLRIFRCLFARDPAKTAQRGNDDPPA